MFKLKKILNWTLLVAVSVLGIYSIYLREVPEAQATYSRITLRENERNLDRMADKDGSLDDLIGELQNFTVYPATGAIVGSSVPVPGILTTDTIVRVVVYSSAATVIGSTSIGRAGEGQIHIAAKVPGPVSTKMSFTFTPSTGSAGFPAATGVIIVSTGYAFEVKYNTGNAFGVALASANSIVNAINSHAWGKFMVRAATVPVATSFSTAAFYQGDNGTTGSALTDQKLLSGISAAIQATVAGGTLTWNQGVYDIHPGYVTIPSSGVIRVNVAAPVTSTDFLTIHAIGKRED